MSIVTINEIGHIYSGMALSEKARIYKQFAFCRLASV